MYHFTYVILCTFDVCSLYTNISHQLGLEAIAFWIDNYTGSHIHDISKQFILEGLKLILENNTFCFGSRHFRQTLGTAMGTKVAPTYATLVLGYLELKLYARFEEMFGSEGKEYIVKNFKRFLDDVFCLWDNDKFGDVTILFDMINDLDPNIKFTIEKNNSQIAILDILVKKSRNSLNTDIYYKHTNSKSYLDFNSCHPRNIDCYLKTCKMYMISQYALKIYE